MRAVVEQQTLEILRRFLAESGSEAPTLGPHSRLVDDLGLKSLDLAAIVARLEMRLAVDAFESEMAVTDVRTVADLARLMATAGAG